METFAPNKNSKELGIDTSREFVVVVGDSNFPEGSIVKISRDSRSGLPWFTLASGEGRRHPFHWKDLYYADEKVEQKKGEAANEVIAEEEDEKQFIDRGQEIIFTNFTNEEKK